MRCRERGHAAESTRLEDQRTWREPDHPARAAHLHLILQRCCITSRSPGTAKIGLKTVPRGEGGGRTPGWPLGRRPTPKPSRPLLCFVLLLGSCFGFLGLWVFC